MTLMELLPLCFKEKLGSKPPTMCEVDGGFTLLFLEPKLRPSSIATNTKEIIMQNKEIISKSDMTFTSYAFV